MLRRARLPGQGLRLGVAHDSLALVRTSALFGRRRELLAQVALATDGDPLDALANGMCTLLAAVPLRGWPLSIVLADELARLWQVTPPPAAASLADLQAAAAMRYQALFGTPVAGWQISADWQLNQAFLAAALPTGLVAVLVDGARAMRCPLVELVPQLVAALNGWRGRRQRGAWFGLLHGTVLSIAAYQGTQLAALRTVLVPAGADRAWLDQHLTREALRLGIAAPTLLQLAGSAPPAWRAASGHVALDCLACADALADASAAVQLACSGSRA